MKISIKFLIQPVCHNSKFIFNARYFWKFNETFLKLSALSDGELLPTFFYSILTNPTHVEFEIFWKG